MKAMEPKKRKPSETKEEWLVEPSSLARFRSLQVGKGLAVGIRLDHKNLVDNQARNHHLLQVDKEVGQPRNYFPLHLETLRKVDNRGRSVGSVGLVGVVRLQLQQVRRHFQVLGWPSSP